MVNGTLGLVIIIAVAFIPALIYLVWMRSAEIYDREPFSAVIGVFLYGLTIAIGLAFILELIAIGIIDAVAGGLSLLAYNFILAVILAPVIEEFTKATGVFTVRSRLTEPENGLIYGAAVGLGFAAAENVLYYTSALSIGTEVFIATAIVRTITSTLLHTSASALVGFGISRSVCFRSWFGTPKSWIPYYFGAVLLHAGFNLLAIAGDFDPEQALNFGLIGLFLSVILVWTTMWWVRRKIAQLDQANQGRVMRCE